MTLAVIQSNVQTSSGAALAVAPSASIEIRDADTDSLVDLYTDRDGTTPAANPVTADASGFFRVYTSPARVNITATLGAYSQTWADVEIGLKEDLAATTGGYRRVAQTARTFRPEDYADDPYDGTDASSAVIAAANAANAAGGGRVVLNGGISLSNTVTIKNGVILDLCGGEVIALANVNLFKVNPGGSVQSGKITATVTSYGAVAVSLVPTGNTRGAQFRNPWARDVNVVLNTGSGTGTGFMIDARSYYVEEMQAHNIGVYFGHYGVLMMAGSNAGTQFNNGNLVLGYAAHDPVYAVYEDYSLSGDVTGVSGNGYYGGTIEKNSYSRLRLATAADVKLNLWDGPVVDFMGDDNRIDSPVYRALLTTINDYGRNNHIIGQDCEYHDGYTLTKHRDRRSNYINIPGMIEFVDHFEGANLDHRWRLSQSSGSGAASGSFGADELGGSAIKLVKSYYRMDTTSGSGSDAILDWPNFCIQAGQRPTIHGTLLLGATSSLGVEFGLYYDTNNFVMFETDVVTPRWQARCRYNGSDSIISVASGTVNFNHLQMLSIYLTNSYAIFKQGNVSTGNNGAGYGQYEETNVASIAVNIPVNVSMKPYIRLANAQGAPKSMRIYDYQLTRTYLTKVA